MFPNFSYTRKDRVIILDNDAPITQDNEAFKFFVDDAVKKVNDDYINWKIPFSTLEKIRKIYNESNYTQEYFLRTLIKNKKMLKDTDNKRTKIEEEKEKLVKADTGWFKMHNDKIEELQDKIEELQYTWGFLNTKVGDLRYIIHEFLKKIVRFRTIEGEASYFGQDDDTSRHAVKLNRPTKDDMPSILRKITEEEFNYLTDDEKRQLRDLQAINNPIYERENDLDKGTIEKRIRELVRSIRDTYLEEEEATERASYDADGSIKGYHAKTHLFEDFAGGRKTKRRNKKHKKSNRRLHKKSNRRTRR